MKDGPNNFPSAATAWFSFTSTLSPFANEVLGLLATCDLLQSMCRSLGTVGEQSLKYCSLITVKVGSQG